MNFLFSSTSLTKPVTTRLKTVFVALIFVFQAGTDLNAQSISPADKVIAQNDAGVRKLDIRFDSPALIQNLLVIVSDSVGQTVFLDNQYRFKGAYSKSIDLTNSPKGNYFVKIIRDEEKINKRITMQ